MARRFSDKQGGAGSALGAFPRGDTSSAPSSTSTLDALTVEYVQASDLSQVVESEAHHVLAVIAHGGEPSFSAIGTRHALDVNLPQLSQQPVLEVWKSSVPVLCDQVQDIRLAFTEEVVFGCLEVSEPPGKVLEDVARTSYERILEYCSQSGYGYLLRMWNFFSDINADQNGLERYKRFCMGRHQAFSTHHKEFTSILPAASAVGTHGGPFQVLFLAAKHIGIPLENPRQVSAYAYPQIYGPKSPSFARATVRRISTGCQLFVAGTASIVGHATQHHGDPIKQTRETLSNIEVLLDRVHTECPEILVAKPSEGLLKVFVRNQDDLHAVRHVLGGHELGQGSILFVLGEMCRKELLVEIEGMWNLSFHSQG